MIRLYFFEGGGEDYTEAHAGPETRTTAIAALPGAVDSAYIVESASSMKGPYRVEEKLRMGLCPLLKDCAPRIES